MEMSRRVLADRLPLFYWVIKLGSTNQKANGSMKGTNPSGSTSNYWEARGHRAWVVRS